MYTGT
jgi:hypothetical protein